MKSRTAEAIPGNYGVLKGSERKCVPGAQRIRPVDPNKQISVLIYVRRRTGGAPMPDHQSWTETQPDKRAAISQEQFTQLYGASPEDLGKVIAFAEAHGLIVGEVNQERRQVIVTGTANELNGAFHVDLGHYRHSKDEFLGHVGAVHLPTELSGIVESVLGLDNRRVARPHVTGGRSGGLALTPRQVAHLYHFPTPLDASSQTIGIIELGGGYHLTDVSAFLSGLGLETPTITDVPVTRRNRMAGSLARPNNEDLETTFDIDIVASIASGAEILVYFGDPSEAGFNAAMSAAVSPGPGRKTPSVITCSWSGAEANWSAAGVRTMNQTLEDAAAKRITVLVASGDHGSDCKVGDGAAHVNYPASDPGATACGGTRTTLLPLSHGTWNDGGPRPGHKHPAGATGGGVSDLTFPNRSMVPAWQQKANIPKSVNDNHAGRGVPDIAGQASGYSGYVILLYGQPTTELIDPSSGFPLGQIGGTSSVAPLYAGLIAVINERLGQQVGFLNPTLYHLAANPASANIFAEINDGKNNHWSAGAADAAHSYSSGPGWDACTGLGVINGQRLLAHLE
jgi:kumamolisin